jgi:hypothetical protein
MATSNKVSSAPTIQSIIARIAAPVIMMTKIDHFRQHFRQGGRVFDRIRTGLVGFMLKPLGTVPPRSNSILSD